MSIDVITTDDAPDCPGCGSEGLLYSRVPNSWTNTRGELVQGYTGVVLCPRCDAQDRYAAPLITWFHVHGQADDEDEEFVQLLVAWASSVFVPELDKQALEDEIEQWRRGEL
ncbi:DUF6300 family protein [Nonomuraea antimicrobica]